MHTYNAHIEYTQQTCMVDIHDFQKYPKYVVFGTYMVLGHAICSFLLREIVLAYSQALKTSKIHSF